MKINITRKDCREASRARKNFNEGQNEVFSWAQCCPLQRAIKRTYDLDFVSLNKDVVRYKEDNDLMARQKFLSKATKEIMSTVDSFFKNNQHNSGMLPVCNADALYLHLQDRKMLETEIALETT